MRAERRGTRRRGRVRRVILGRRQRRQLGHESGFVLDQQAFVFARSPRHGLMAFGQKYADAYDAAMAAAETDDDAAQDESDDAESDRYY